MIPPAHRRLGRNLVRSRLAQPVSLVMDGTTHAALPGGRALRGVFIRRDQTDSLGRVEVVAAVPTCQISVVDAEALPRLPRRDDRLIVGGEEYRVEDRRDPSGGVYDLILSAIY